jgi:hypothetical protein
MDGRKEEFVQNLVGVPEGNSPLGRPQCRWENCIKMDCKEIG